jgi:hypothetical protein
LRARVRDEAAAVLQRLEAGAVLGDDDRARIEELAHAVAEAVEASPDGDA